MEARMALKLYLIGSLRNPEIPKIANKIRELGFDVFDDWFAAGPEADDKWRDYEKGKGHSFKEALKGYAANHVFDFDFKHLKTSDIVVLALPAGKSGHMEFLWALCEGKKGFILLLDNPDRWDVMYLLVVKVIRSFNVICENFEELKVELTKIKKKTPR